MKLSASVKAGRLVFDQPEALVICLREHEGKRVVVDVERFRVTRSDAANRFYWACVVPVVAAVLSDELQQKDREAPSLTKEEAHEACKRHFLGVEVVAGLPVQRSTRLLTTAQFAEYVERIRAWCAQAGYYIANPGERVA